MNASPNTLKSQTACFTGHRNIENLNSSQLTAAIIKIVRELVEMGIYRFYSGGAVGFDLVAASAIISLKNEIPHLKLIFALPFKNHFTRWSQKDKILFSKLSAFADEIVYVTDSKVKFAPILRNRYMIDRSSVCIYYLRRKTGGTHHTVQYAKRKGLSLIPVDYYETENNLPLEK